MGELEDVQDILGHLEHDRAFQEAAQLIVEGVVTRRQNDDVSQAYRVYTREIEQFTEQPAIMRLVLSDPSLKIWFFRVFGYRGELQFSMMQAVWLRDLPLLTIGRDAHLGYGMMLGTSQILPDGESVLLRRISIGARTFFNQHTVVEGGTRVGEDCSVGVRVSIGGEVQVGDNVEVGDFARIGDQVILGAGSRVGCGAMIGRAAIVDPGMAVEDGADVPAFHRLTSGGLFPRPHRRIAA
ncbi:MAG: hypothetical protein AAFU49_21340 [Pseudomonadota bacterium]